MRYRQSLCKPATVKTKSKEGIMLKHKETVKTILITVLITGIVSFVSGAYYQNQAIHQVTLTAQQLSAQSK
jgi:hypothetical protein